MSIDVTKLSWAIGAMRRAGMGDGLIAHIISDIRVATLNEERARLETWVRDNPPDYGDSYVIKTEIERHKL